MDYPVQSPEQLGIYLRSLRKSRGLTQGALGKMLGVSTARVAYIEHHPGTVGSGQLLKILHLLGAHLYLDDGAAKREALANTRQPTAVGEW